MDTPSHRLTLLVALIAAVGAAKCYGQDQCSGSDLVEVRSLAALPTGIRQLLPRGTGHDGIADRGGRFNVTDALTRETAALPMRRFTLAAVGATCAVVAIEYGGIAHGFGTREYRLIGEVWREVWPATAQGGLSREPKSVSDLLR